MTDLDLSIIVRAGAPDDRLAASLLQQTGQVRFERIPVAARSGDELERAFGSARGEFVTWLDVDDRLHPDALNLMFRAAAGADVVYSDESWSSRSIPPFLKPGWSPERARCQPYFGKITLVRRTTAVSVGGVDPTMGSAAVWDLVLRCAEREGCVEHVERILCESTAVRAEVEAADARRVVAAAVERAGLPAAVVGDPRSPTGINVAPALPAPPLVSIVIPTRGSARVIRGESTELVVHCVDSVLKRSTYPNLEVVVVADVETPAGVLEELRRLDERHVHIEMFHDEFNFSDKINVGPRRARGAMFLLLNDDMEVIRPDWIEQLVMYASVAGVGAVGALLHHEDGSLQHCGVVGVNGIPGHLLYRAPGDEPGHWGSVRVAGNYLAVTAACLMVTKEAFELVGGFSTEFPVNYNDVDFCLKLHDAGFRNVYAPGAELFHFEGSSRSGVVQRAEAVRLGRRWGRYLRNDPYYNAGFSTSHADFVIRRPHWWWLRRPWLSSAPRARVRPAPQPV